MKTTISLVCVLLLSGIALGPSAAAPVSSCPGAEAKTASGACVNPGLSASLRLRSTLMSQPKISETAFPIPPLQDRAYPRPNEYNRYELTRGVFSTNPSPFSCHPNCVSAPVITAPPRFTTAR